MSQSPPLDLQLAFRVVRCGYGTLAAIAPPSCRRLPLRVAFDRPQLPDRTTSAGRNFSAMVR